MNDHNSKQRMEPIASLSIPEYANAQPIFGFNLVTRRDLLSVRMTHVRSIPGKLGDILSRVAPEGNCAQQILSKHGDRVYNTVHEILVDKELERKGTVAFLMLNFNKNQRTDY